MEHLHAPLLPDLTPEPCPDCQGEGGFAGVHTEPGDVCRTCGGAGEIDVCPDCHLPPTVVHGMEVCGCTVLVSALGAAA